MPKSSILETTKRVLNLLKKNEYTINQIASQLRIQWKTAIKSLEFLKDIGLVEESRGKTTYRSERLFKVK